MFNKLSKFALQLAVAASLFPVWAGSYDDFFRAVGLDNERVVRALLARGFDPNTISEYGEVPLSLAFKEESLKVAEVLVAQPGLLIDQANAKGETPLMIAALTGRQVWIDRLLDRGARLNPPSGWTPLHYAASGPDPDVVRRLIERGADIEARSPNGTTPLMMAAAYGDQRSAQLLMRRGADPRARNQRDLSAADFAREAGRDALADEIERAARPRNSGR